MSEELIQKIAELGASTFILFIALVITIKISNVFSNVSKKIDNLADVLSKNNKELSNQLTQCIVLQENLITTMKETVTLLNENNIKMLKLENKMDNIAMNVKDATLDLKKTNRKVEIILDRLEIQVSQ